MQQSPLKHAIVGTSTHREMFRIHDLQPCLVELIRALVNIAQVDCHLEAQADWSSHSAPTYTIS